MLGGIRYTKLGHYHTIDDQDHIGMYFVEHVGKEYGDSHQVRAVLQSFRDDLDKITEEIERRNKFRTYTYVEMLPNGIPQSINI